MTSDVSNRSRLSRLGQLTGGNTTHHIFNTNLPSGWFYNENRESDIWEELEKKEHDQRSIKKYEEELKKYENISNLKESSEKLTLLINHVEQLEKEMIHEMKKIAEEEGGELENNALQYIQNYKTSLTNIVDEIGELGKSQEILMSDLKDSFNILKETHTFIESEKVHEVDDNKESDFPALEMVLSENISRCERFQMLYSDIQSFFLKQINGFRTVIGSKDVEIYELVKSLENMEEKYEKIKEEKQIQRDNYEKKITALNEKFKEVEELIKMNIKQRDQIIQLKSQLLHSEQQKVSIFSHTTSQSSGSSNQNDVEGMKLNDTKDQSETKLSDLNNRITTLTNEIKNVKMELADERHKNIELNEIVEEKSAEINGKKSDVRDYIQVERDKLSSFPDIEPDYNNNDHLLSEIIKLKNEIITQKHIHQLELSRQSQILHEKFALEKKKVIESIDRSEHTNLLTSMISEYEQKIKDIKEENDKIIIEIHRSWGAKNALLTKRYENKIKTININHAKELQNTRDETLFALQKTKIELEDQFNKKLLLSQQKYANDFHKLSNEIDELMFKIKKFNVIKQRIISQYNIPESDFDITDDLPFYNSLSKLNAHPIIIEKSVIEMFNKKYEILKDDLQKQLEWETNKKKRYYEQETLSLVNKQQLQVRRLINDIEMTLTHLQNEGENAFTLESALHKIYEFRRNLDRICDFIPTTEIVILEDANIRTRELSKTITELRNEKVELEFSLRQKDDEIRQLKEKLRLLEVSDFDGHVSSKVTLDNLSERFISELAIEDEIVKRYKENNNIFTGRYASFTIFSFTNNLIDNSVQLTDSSVAIKNKNIKLVNLSPLKRSQPSFEISNASTKLSRSSSYSVIIDTESLRKPRIFSSKDVTVPVVLQMPISSWGYEDMRSSSSKSLHSMVSGCSDVKGSSLFQVHTIARRSSVCGTRKKNDEYVINIPSQIHLSSSVFRNIDDQNQEKEVTIKNSASYNEEINLLSILKSVHVEEDAYQSLLERQVLSSQRRSSLKGGLKNNVLNKEHPDTSISDDNFLSKARIQVPKDYSVSSKQNSSCKLLNLEENEDSLIFRNTCSNFADKPQLCLSLAFVQADIPRIIIRETLSEPQRIEKINNRDLVCLESMFIDGVDVRSPLSLGYDTEIHDKIISLVSPCMHRKVNETSNLLQENQYIDKGDISDHHEGVKYQLKLEIKKLQQQLKNSQYKHTELKHNVLLYAKKIRTINEDIIMMKTELKAHIKDLRKSSRELMAKAMKKVDKVTDKLLQPKLKPIGLQHEVKQVEFESIAPLRAEDPFVESIQLMKQCLLFMKRYSENENNIARSFQSDCSAFESFLTASESLTETNAIFIDRIKAIKNALFSNVDQLEKFSNMQATLLEILKQCESQYNFIKKINNEEEKTKLQRVLARNRDDSRILKSNQDVQFVIDNIAVSHEFIDSLQIELNESDKLRKEFIDTRINELKNQYQALNNSSDIQSIVDSLLIDVQNLLAEIKPTFSENSTNEQPNESDKIVNELNRKIKKQQCHINTLTAKLEEANRQVKLASHETPSVKSHMKHEEEKYLDLIESYKAQLNVSKYSMQSIMSTRLNNSSDIYETIKEEFISLQNHVEVANSERDSLRSKSCILEDELSSKVNVVDELSAPQDQLKDRIIELEAMIKNQSDILMFYDSNIHKLKHEKTQAEETCMQIKAQMEEVLGLNDKLASKIKDYEEKLSKNKCETNILQNEIDSLNVKHSLDYYSKSELLHSSVCTQTTHGFIPNQVLLQSSHNQDEKLPLVKNINKGDISARYCVSESLSTNIISHNTDSSSTEVLEDVDRISIESKNGTDTTSPFQLCTSIEREFKNMQNTSNFSVDHSKSPEGKEEVEQDDFDCEFFEHRDKESLVNIQAFSSRVIEQIHAPLEIKKEKKSILPRLSTSIEHNSIKKTVKSNLNHIRPLSSLSRANHSGSNPTSRSLNQGNNSTRVASSNKLRPGSQNRGIRIPTLQPHNPAFEPLGNSICWKSACMISPVNGSTGTCSSRKSLPPRCQSSNEFSLSDDLTITKID